MSTRAEARRRAGAVVLGVGAVALATAAAWPIYGTAQAIIVGVVAGGTGVAIGVAASLRRRGGRLLAVALPVAYLVLVVPLAVPGAMTSPTAWLAGVRDGIAGIVLGWKQLLTLDPPLGDYQAVLVPLFLVVLVGGAVVTAVAALPGVRAAVAVPVVIAMSTFGVLFGPSAADAPLVVGPIVLPSARPVLHALAILLLCLGWLAARARLDRVEAIERAGSTSDPRTPSRAPRPGRALLGGAILVVAIVAGLAVAPAAAGVADRSTLRDDVDPMLVLRRTESPLTGYRAWFAGDALDARLLVVAGAGRIDRLRFATLSKFDGVRFAVDDSAAGEFSRVPSSARVDGDVSVLITLGPAWTGPWLPLPGIMTGAPEFSGPDTATLTDGLSAAPGDETAIVVTGSGDGATVGAPSGTTYRVAGLPVPDAADVLAGATGDASRIDPTAFPSLTAWIDLQQVPRTGDGLLELVDRLRERGYLSHARAADAAAQGWIAALDSKVGYAFEPSLAGHSTARIEALFASLIRQEVLAGPDADPALLVAAAGDEEQFAVATALLARAFGFDSRVVVGVRLTTDEPLASVAPCVSGVCTGANVTAWAEVLGPDGAWGTVDAGPQFASPITRVTDGEILPEHPTTPQRETSELVAPPSSQVGDTNAEPVERDGGGADWLAILLPVVRVVGLVGLGVLLLVLPGVVLVGAKRIRRAARRRTAEAEAAVVGAWEELIDLYADQGVVAGDRGPRRWAADRSCRPAAARLAEIADAAVFADAPTSDADRDAAWSIVDAERRALREAGPVARIRAALTARSFARHLGVGEVESPALEVVRDRQRSGATTGGEGAR